MRQYYAIKKKHPGAVLLFRMGDFYEAFDGDAKTLSRTLGITLTTRGNGKADDVPMAGFPHHALESHLPKLVRAGLRVAICEQVETPEEAGGNIVKREVTEVVTPGVSFQDQLLDPKRANYLAAVHWSGDGRCGVAYLDASTGEFAVAETAEDKLETLLETVQPAEVVIDKRRRVRLESSLRETPFVVTEEEDWVFGYDFAYETLLRHFETHSLKGFGVDDLEAGLVAAGAALHYLSETQKGRLGHVRKLRRHATGAFIALDPQTKRNLELVRPLHEGSSEGALINILDQTETPMGGRRLRAWLVRPLREVEKIRQRLDAVEALVTSPRLRKNIREDLDAVGDLERLAGKIATGRATPRDLVAVKQTLEKIPALKTLLADEPCPTLQRLEKSLTPCAPIAEMIGKALVDDPPAQITEGGLIREGFSEELDSLRRLARSGKSWVAKLQKEESKRTGIPSLKVGFNKVFGYYLEVTHTHTEKVPDEYIRKQTLKNAERYITPELKEYEEKILTAEEKIGHLEFDLFNDLRAKLAEETAALQLNAALLAMLDCFAALAEVAERHGYTRPEVSEGRVLDIKGGRHPVVEQALPAGEPFIPNDVRLDPENEQILLITGPNMAGKSVVLRQVGLIVLLAQVGAFVPAEKAEVGVVDRIFTRVGAQDNLAAGESTFLVEMNETANILNNATPRSLILLDEVGRGTSTFDGLSIAWALVEYLHELAEVAARTLFATHYHELNELSARFGRIRNYRIQVQEHEGKVVFLRKLVEGGADHSYGIEVAKMAGLPEPVVIRAREILGHLEGQHLALEETAEAADADVAGDGAASSAPKAKARKAEAGAVPSLSESAVSQMDLFHARPDPVAEELKEALQTLDLNRMTPIEALLKLSELKQISEK